MPTAPDTAPRGHPFDRLTPPAVLDALDAVGVRGDGRLLQLNSYENRVFQVHLEDGGVVVAKFYRPGRWTDGQIAEEHGFAAELAAAEVPVVAPVALADGRTLATVAVDGEPFRLAVYPRRAGSGPDLEDPAVLRWLGRFIGRLHAVGERQRFAHRRQLTPEAFGRDALRRIAALDTVPPAEWPAWHSRAERALDRVSALWTAWAAEVGERPGWLRLHGDCHPGNILWRSPDDGGHGPHIVDLDDAVAGPAVQDLWMWLSGDRLAQEAQLRAVLEGYETFRPLDRRELVLVEALRTLRMLQHSAWLAERWEDPAFPAAFPWFTTAGYWSQQTLQLGEQLAAMDEPPLLAG